MRNLIGDKAIKQKRDKKQPLAHKTRMNEFARVLYDRGRFLLLSYLTP